MDLKLIDIQVNGYKGISFTDQNLTIEQCKYAFQQYIKDTECISFFPTIITTSKETYEHVIPILNELSNNSEFKDHIGGYHFEGPFIAKEAKGAHEEKHICAPDIDYFNYLYNLTQGKLKIMTIAAEYDLLSSFIKNADSKNVIISLGHQIANVQQIEKASNYGAKCMTHLGNGIPQMIDRHNNSIYAGLSNDKLTTMIIPDGFHLPDYFMKIVFKAKGIDNVICVSDISPIGGLPSGEYSGKKIGMGDEILRIEENGKLHIPSRNCLAGSSMNIRQCANYLIKTNLLSKEELEKVFYYNIKKLLKI